MDDEAETALVQAVGDRIGYGRTMQLAQQLWSETLASEGLPPGGAHSVYCCEAFLVPCPNSAHVIGDGHKCDWCCGAGRVTKKVAWAMSKLVPPT